MRVVVLGNSVGLRVRPPSPGSGGTYADRLRRMGHEVMNRSRSGVIVTEAFRSLEEDVIAESPDGVIINFGIVEVSPRRRVRRINNATIRNYYVNRVFHRDFDTGRGWSRVRHFILRVANGTIRRIARVLRRNWQWLPTPRFIETTEALIQTILKETPASVVLLGINECSQRVEDILPGSLAAIDAANLELSALSDRCGNRVHFLDPRNVLREEPLDGVVPDGIHYSTRGHLLMAEAIHEFLSVIPTPITD